MPEIDLAYPIGRYQAPATIDQSARNMFVAQIAAAPAALRDAVRSLDERQLATPYRPGGWSVRQVVHHLPDSHCNAYVRFKLALTEESYQRFKKAGIPYTAKVPASVAPRYVKLVVYEYRSGSVGAATTKIK